MFNKNALVIDDSATARTVLKHQLKQFDVVVESVCDGSHALDLLRSHTPDVIFLDHMMPGLDGFQVLELLKSNPSTRAIPVVMYTSQAAPQYTKEAKLLGAIAVIPKKVTDEQLMEALDKAELYQLKAANDCDTAANDLSEQGKTSATTKQPVRDDLTNIATPISSHESWKASQPANQTVPNTEAIPAEDADKQKKVPAISSITATSTQAPDNGKPHAVGPPALPEQYKTRDWLMRALILGLLVVQFYTITKYNEQGRTIDALETELRNQQQMIPNLQAKLVDEQRDLSEATWRQVEFLSSIMAQQIEED